MVDRGGLNYPIRVRDEFSKTTALFRKEIGAAKKAFREFQTELRSGKGATKALRDTTNTSRQLTQAQREQAKATRDTVKPLTDEERILKRLAAASKKQRDLERESVRLRNAQTAETHRRAAQEARLVRERERAAKQQEQALRAAGAAEARLQRLQVQSLAATARAERERERTSNRQQRDAAAQLQTSINSQRSAEALAVAQLRAQRQERNAAARTSAQAEAERRVNRELFRRQVLLKQIDLLRARSRASLAQGDILGGRASIDRAKQLEKSLRASDSAATRLLFTFRRLVGVLALFTLARRAVQVFNELVVAGLRFNDTIEASTTGIAGLVVTLADVRNDLGESVDNAQELQLALGLARDQIRKLRQDSLRTVATFEQLLDTFQIAVGPGLAAGLGLDQIRQLTVDISQASSALGVPQNQLAEEVRSLLSGTIQARTTRIATALGITNADIRRLKETGELFEFLEDKFSGFAAAAERQARTTLAGISTLVQGVVQELLGQAAQPLFDELLSLGNQLFDEVVGIRDEAGNIRPNRKAVDAFREIFNALRNGVQAAREFGQNLGFEGLQTVASGLALIFDAIVGSLSVIGGVLTDIVGIISEVREAIGLTSENAGTLGEQIGIWATRIGLAHVALRFLNVELLKTLAAPSAIIAAFFLIGKGIELILERIHGVNLNLRETVELVVLGLLRGFLKTGAAVAIFGENLKAVFGLKSRKRAELEIADIRLQTAARVKGIEEEINGIITKRGRTGLGPEETIARLDQEIEARRAIAKSLARQLKVADDIATVEGDSLGLVAQLRERFIQNNRALADAIRLSKSLNAEASANALTSTAGRAISDLSEEVFNLNKELRKSQLEFEQVERAAGGVGGFAGQIEGIFNEQEIANAERLLKIRSTLAEAERNIADISKRVTAERLEQIKAAVRAGDVAKEAVLATDPDAVRASIEAEAAARKKALEGLNLTTEEGALVSLLRDEEALHDAINGALEQSALLAASRAATEARQVLPALQQENALLQAQVAAERALTTAKINQEGSRREAVVAARGAVEQARAELRITRQRLQAELDVREARIAQLPSGPQRDALQAELEAARERRDLELQILGLRVAGAEQDRQKAEQRATGTFTQGARQGLIELADELPTIFEVGLELTKDVVRSFANFAATEIVNAIIRGQQEGVSATDLFKEAAGQFVQQIATQLLEQVIQNIIGILLRSLFQRVIIEQSAAQSAAAIKVTAATTAANIEIAAATAAAAIRAGSSGVGGHSGGLVGPKGFHSGGFAERAKGFRAGGRPKSISKFDTVPAYLQPGEFVIRKSIVDAVGANVFSRINNGNFSLVPSATQAATAGDGGGAQGFQGGGLVSDRNRASAGASGSGDRVVVVPAVVARDAEMERLTKGGQNALMSFMQENSGDINTLLDRSAGRR